FKLGYAVQALDTMVDCFHCSKYSIGPFTPHRIRYLPDQQLDVSSDYHERIVDLIGHHARETGQQPHLGASTRELALRILDGDGGEGRKCANQLLVVGVKGHDLVASVARIDQLKDADDVARGLHEWHHEDRSSAIPGLRIDRGIECVRSVCRNIVGVRKSQDVPGTRDIRSEASLAKGELGLEELPHFSLAKAPLQQVILDDGELESIIITKVERAGLCMSQPSGLGQNPGGE